MPLADKVTKEDVTKKISKLILTLEYPKQHNKQVTRRSHLILNKGAQFPPKKSRLVV